MARPETTNIERQIKDELLTLQEQILMKLIQIKMKHKVNEINLLKKIVVRHNDKG